MAEHGREKLFESVKVWLDKSIAEEDRQAVRFWQDLVMSARFKLDTSSLKSFAKEERS